MQQKHSRGITKRETARNKSHCNCFSLYPLPQNVIYLPSKNLYRISYLLFYCHLHLQFSPSSTSEYNDRIRLMNTEKQRQQRQIGENVIAPFFSPIVCRLFFLALLIERIELWTAYSITRIHSHFNRRDWWWQAETLLHVPLHSPFNLWDLIWIIH